MADVVRRPMSKVQGEEVGGTEADSNGSSSRTACSRESARARRDQTAK